MNKHPVCLETELRSIIIVNNDHFLKKILPVPLPTTHVNEDYCFILSLLVKMYERVWTWPQGMMGAVGLSESPE